MQKLLMASALGLLAASLASCQPTVRVQGGGEPIVINLNVKIEQEVRVRVERDLDELIESDSDLF